jgi:hypothetical protein
VWKNYWVKVAQETPQEQKEQAEMRMNQFKHTAANQAKFGLYAQQKQQIFQKIFPLKY